MKLLILVFISLWTLIQSQNTTIINFPSEWAGNCFEVFDESSNITIDCGTPNTQKLCPPGSILISNKMEAQCNIYVNGLYAGNMTSRSIHENKNYKTILPQGSQEEDIFVPYKYSEPGYRNCFAQTMDNIHFISTGTLSLDSELFTPLLGALNVKELRITCNTLNIPNNMIFKFPGSHVIVNALTSTGTGTIDVTPSTCIMPAPQLKPGSNGEQGGTIEFYVIDQKDQVTLIANGGTGQTGGAGGAGTIETAPPTVLCIYPSGVYCVCGVEYECSNPSSLPVVSTHFYESVNSNTPSDMGIRGYTVNGLPSCPLGGPSIPAASAGGPGPAGNIYSYYPNNYQVNPGNSGSNGAPGIGAGVTTTTFMASFIELYVVPGTAYTAIGYFPDYQTMISCKDRGSIDPCKQYFSLSSPALITCPSTVVGPITPPNPPLPGNPTPGSFTIVTSMLRKGHCAILETQIAIYFRNLNIDKIQDIYDKYHNYPVEDSVFCSQFTNTLQLAITNLMAGQNAWNTQIGMVTSFSVWVEGKVSQKVYSDIYDDLSDSLQYITYAKSVEQLVNAAQNSITNLQLDQKEQIVNIRLSEIDYNKRNVALQNDYIQQSALEKDINARVTADEIEAHKIMLNTINNIKDGLENIRKKFVHAALLKGIIKISKSIVKHIFGSIFLVSPTIPIESAAGFVTMSPVYNYTENTTNIISLAVSSPPIKATSNHAQIASSLSMIFSAYIDLLIELKHIETSTNAGGIIAQRIEDNDPVLQKEKQQLAILDVDITNNVIAMNRDQTIMSSSYLAINKAQSTISSLTDSIIIPNAYVNTDFSLQVMTQSVYGIDGINQDTSMLYNDCINVGLTPTVVDLANTKSINRFIKTVLISSNFSKDQTDYILEPVRKTFNELCEKMISNYNNANRMMQSSMYYQLVPQEIQNLNIDKTTIISLYDKIQPTEDQQQIFGVTLIANFATNVDSKITIKFNKNIMYRDGYTFYMFPMQTNTIYAGKYQSYLNQTIMDPPVSNDITGLATFVGMSVSDFNPVLYTNPSVWDPILVTISDGTIESLVLKIDYYYRTITDTTIKTLFVQSNGFPTFVATCDLTRECDKNTTITATFKESVYIYNTGSPIVIEASEYDMYGNVFSGWNIGIGSRKINLSMYTDKRLIANYKTIH